ncbi:MAG: alpha/beta fold hydrolase, partial [Anaerolineaceae bacterium]|nr:alpha/beta fold hydrolase [Anaerolineaceae bacterium]
MLDNGYMRNDHLDGEDFHFQGNDTGILLLHGFTATTTEVRLIGDKLHQAGYTVAAPLLPGHGTDPDDLNHATWQMWLEKVKTFYEMLARECNRVFVVAESMGSLLALELAVQHPEIKGLLLFAPAIKVHKLWLASFVAPFKKYLAKSSEDDGLPWKGYNVYPVRASVEMLKLQQQARKHLAKVTPPTLLFTGEHDHTLTDDAAEIVLEGLGSKEKGLIHLAESPHCILLDGELDQAFQDIDQFIKDHP